MLSKTITILSSTLRQNKWSLLMYTGISVIFLWMFVALFPTIRESAESLEQAYEALTDSFFAALGIEEIVFSTLEGFLATEHLSIIWPLLVILMMTSFASNFLSGEIEKGTVEITLARPISRSAYFFGKYFAAVVSLLIFVAISIYLAIPLAELHGVEYQAQSYTTFAVMGFLYGWSILSLAFLFSSIFKEKSKTYFAIGGILLSMYVITILSRLVENLENLQYISFFSYIDQSSLLAQEYDTVGIIVFVTVAIISTLIASWRWNKRDIPA